jgi:hypothetical protein
VECRELRLTGTDGTRRPISWIGCAVLRTQQNEYGAKPDSKPPPFRS